MSKRYGVISALVESTGVSESTVKRRIKELGYTAEQVYECPHRLKVVELLLDHSKAELMVEHLRELERKLYGDENG